MLSIRLFNIGRVVFFGACLGAVGYLVGKASISGTNTHLLLGISLTLLCIALSTGHPTTILYAILLYLPFMGLIRRLLLVYFGYISYDPMVIMEPLVVLLLASYWFYHYLWLKDITFEDTTIFKLIRYLILVDMLEILNPLQHGLSIGLSGLMFYIVPLFWMLLSKLHFDDSMVRRIVHTVFILGIVLSLYGLKQTYFGIFPFEQKWVHMSAYVSLYVGNHKLRAFSTPDNAQEYAFYLALGISISWAYILRAKPWLKVVGAIGLAIMGFALFMESSRSPIVLVTFAIAITSVVAARTLRSRVTVAMVVSAMLVAVFIAINHVPNVSQNSLVSHQLNGLAHPLNSKDSSLSGHSGRMFSGILEGIKLPIGHGLGSTTVAAGKFNATSQGTEIDISNMFVSDGIIGGAIYLALIGWTIITAIRNVHKDQFLHLAGLGMLVASLSQWSNGGLYSVSAVVWVMIGYIDRKSISETQGKSVNIVPK